MDECKHSIQQIIDGYQTAVRQKDVDAFVSLYAQDVVIFDIWGEWAYTGIDEWRATVINWFNSLGDEQVIVDVTNARVISESNLAFIHAFIAFKGLSADGDELHAMQNRFTWMLQNREGGWKIVHEHSSAPIDFETAKVMLQRQ